MSKSFLHAISILLLSFITLSNVSVAQEDPAVTYEQNDIQSAESSQNSEVELQTRTESDLDMATGMRSSGKIWVVIGVILIILFGLFALLLYIESRLRKLESVYSNNS